MAIPAIPPIGISDLAPDVASVAQDVSSTDATAQSGKSFGGFLGEALGKLAHTNAEANSQAQALATGQAQDIPSVVMAIEHASLEFQLASTVRNKAVEAYQEIFRMQV
jgi:flagellar hook-basal body complex protein FliE